MRPRPEHHLPERKTTPTPVIVMEEMHKIHKDVPYGYWVLWVEPAFKALTRRWRERPGERPLPAGLDQLSSPH